MTTTRDSGAHDTTEIIEYFDAKASAYDDVDDQPYWMLSDKLLWASIQDAVLPNLGEGFTFLDAGGGTGRWTDRIATSCPTARGTLFDLTPAMSDVAQDKAAARGYADRLDICQGDLADVATVLAGRSFDLVFSFHNVLGFVRDPAQVVADLAGLLAPGGLLVSFVPNRWHAAFFNLALGQLDDAESSLTGRGRFTDSMPTMHLFTPESISGMYAAAGLHVDLVSGFPSLIYPGYQETQLHGSTGSLSDLLGDADRFDRVYEMERSTSGTGDALAARGNNLFVIGRRGAGR